MVYGVVEQRPHRVQLYELQVVLSETWSFRLAFSTSSMIFQKFLGLSFIESDWFASQLGVLQPGLYEVVDRLAELGLPEI